MNKIRIQNITPGMCLAADVKNHHGMVILPKGSRLKKKHIDIFQMWGVVEIEVEDKPEVASPGKVQEIDPILYEKAKEEAMKRYRLTNVDHPAIKEIFNLDLYRIIVQKTKEASHGAT